MSARLSLLGLGLEPEVHATVETLQAAGRCDVVFWAGAEAGTTLLKRFAKDVRTAGTEDQIFAELKAGHSVAWATPAHPVVFNAVAANLAKRCEAADIPWETFGAVSSAGVAMAAAGMTLGEDIFGVQAFDAAAVAAGTATINPAVVAVIHFYAKVDGAAFGKVLATIYPEKQKARWCSSKGIVGETTVGKVGGEVGVQAAGNVLLLEPAVTAKPRWAEMFESRHRTEQQAVGDHKRAPAWVKG